MEFLLGVTGAVVKKTTIKDVAQLAGVSYQTVSRVINHKKEVSPATASIVRKAMKTLNYTPDPLARSLVGKNSHTIGVVISTYTGHTCNLILQSADRVVRSYGYNLVIVGTETHSSAEPITGNELTRQRLEGLLVIYHGAVDDPHTLLSTVSPDIPVVSTGYEIDRPEAKIIQVNTYEGARIATEYLLSKGHTKIATITGSPKASEMHQRKSGFLDTLKSHEVAFNPTLEVSGEWSIESGYKAMLTLLNQKKEFTAVFTHNDDMAFGAIRALKENGFEVPRDVSVIGFDNNPLSKCSIPSLTTVSYPAAELGAYSASLLVWMVRSHLHPSLSLKPPQKPKLEMELIVRESTAS
jgi:LacI family transcriptional regulator